MKNETYCITYKTKELPNPVELEIIGKEGVVFFIETTSNHFDNLEWFKIQDSDLNIIRKKEFLSK